MKIEKIIHYSYLNSNLFKYISHPNCRGGNESEKRENLVRLSIEIGKKYFTENLYLIHLTIK